MSVSSRALTSARSLLRSLSSAIQLHALYPAGHPNRVDVVREVVEHTRALQAVTVDDPVVFVTRHSFYLADALLARESLSLFRLVQQFEAAGVHAVEFTEGLAESDVHGLVEVLAGDRTLVSPIGAIHLNRVQPTVGGPVVEDLDLTKLQRAYGMGLEVIRESAIAIATGSEIDLDAATRVVGNLADEVAREPANALLLTTVKSYDEYTYYHMVNVALLSLAVAQAIGLHRDQVLTLGLGALLHDVGKVNMPEDVLFHVGRLSEEQWRIVQKHPVDGAGQVFRTGEDLYHPAAAVGVGNQAACGLGGYPSLTHRHHPSLPARLVSVADCFDAVTSKRAYRSPAERREALGILQSGSGKGFDPRLVRIFTAMLGLFPIGSIVELDTGEVAIVVRNDEERLSRPTVLVVLGPDRSPVEPEERDLRLERDGRAVWSVLRTLDPDVLGIDVVGYLTGGDLEAMPDPTPTGLVHEPSHGEELPEGYVDTHNEPGAQDHGHLPEGGSYDPDVMPPLDGDQDHRM
jgi:HD-GYP domain-containing protein (c-di-GMP phosphodiesterase class II)